MLEHHSGYNAGNAAGVEALGYGVPAPPLLRCRTLFDAQCLTTSPLTPPFSQAPPNPLISLGAFFLVSKFVNWTLPEVVLGFRIAFVVLMAVKFCMWWLLRSRIEAAKAANSASPVWMKAAPPGLMAMLSGGAEEGPAYKKTTIYEHELAHAEAQLTAVKTGPLFNMALSFYMNMNVPLALACVNEPLGLFGDAVARKYLLGEDAPGAYGELTSEPGGDAAAAPAPAALPAAVVPPAAKAGKTTPAADLASESAVCTAWESKEPFPLATFESLVSSGKNINYQTADGWTALMVAAGRAAKEVDCPPAVLRRLLALGADPAQTDNDGWSALHWSCFHDAPSAVEVICGAYSSGAGDGAPAPAPPTPGKALGDRHDLAALLRAVDAKGRTPLEVALAESNVKAAEAIKAACLRAGVKVAA